MEQESSSEKTMTDPETHRAPEQFTVEVEGREQPIQVRLSDLPFGETGKPGSVLDILLNQGVEIDHACGGVCACSTCHIYVKSGLDSCSAPDEDEQDMLDMAPDVRENSRLACQCVPSGTKSLVVEIPNWNRNLAKERH